MSRPLRIAPDLGRTALLVVVGVVGNARAATVPTSSDKVMAAERRCNARMSELRRSVLPELRAGSETLAWCVASGNDPLSPFGSARVAAAILPASSRANAPWRDSGLAPFAGGVSRRSFSMTARGWTASVDLHYVDLDEPTPVLPQLFAALEQCVKDLPDADQAEGKKANP